MPSSTVSVIITGALRGIGENLVSLLPIVAHAPRRTADRSLNQGTPAGCCTMEVAVRSKAD